MRTISRLLTIFTLATLAIAADAPGFKLTKHYAVPGDGGFDYVTFDASSNRVYASHENEVDVVDADSGKLLGKVTDTPGVHGTAIVPELHRGFTTNGDEDTVSVFDTTTFKTIKKIKVDKDPDDIFYDPYSKRVLVCHGDSEAITAIDPDKETVLGKVALGGKAEATKVDGKGSGYVNLEDKAVVVKYDPVALTVKAKFPITGCKTPTGMAIDPASSRLFIGCRSKVMAVMNADNGKVITTLPIGTRVDAVTYDADNKMIFCSNADGTISVFHQKGPDQYESMGDIKTQESAKTMALDPKTKRMFLTAAEMIPPPAGSKGRPKPKPGSFAVLVVERQ